MKKLIIASAIAFVAVCSEAASVSWTSSGLFIPVATAEGYVPIKTSGDGKNTLFPTGSDLNLALAIVYTDATGGELTYDLGITGPKLTGNGSVSSQTLWDAATAKSFLSGKDADGNSYSADGKNIILRLTGEYADANYNYALSMDVTKDLSSIDNVGVSYSFAAGTPSVKDTVWTATAIPEPTSGLLLLLGVAGLALRRRRA